MKIEEYARLKLAQYQTVVNDRDCFYFLSGIRIGLRAAIQCCEWEDMNSPVDDWGDINDRIAMIKAILSGKCDLPEVGE